jgi:hypothetical protein
MTVWFEKSLISDFNHSLVNASNVDIYVVPAVDRHEENGFEWS